MADDLLLRAEDRHDPSPLWEKLFSLPVLLLLGFAVFELTAQPGLGLAVLCLKFGLPDVQVARWLRSRDPQRARGRATFWLYVSLAGGKVAGAAFGLCLVLALVYAIADAGKPPAQRQGNAPPPEVVGISLVLVTAIGLTLLASLRAFWLAWWSRVRLWLGPEARRARRDGFWPPRPDGLSGRNDTNILFGVTFGIVVSGLFALLFACNLGNRPGVFDHIVSGVLVLVSIVTLGRILRSFQRRTVARSAAQCWDDVPDVLCYPEGARTSQDTP
jgi:hypothetical protein